MPIRTTTIGAYPKPEYVPVSDWFREESTVAKDPTRALDNCIECQDPGAVELLDRATHEVVREQDQLGIDIPGDGEVRRENYIHYHCRNLDGINFSRFVAGIDIFRAPAIMNASYFMNGILLTLSR